MKDDIRPDPYILLKALQRTDRASLKGKLSIFFGMAAGAGKTYTMLEAAQARLKEGADIIIGLAETHGRIETESLLNGLTVIPRKKISYRNTILEELDVDNILSRRPSLVLVDELAHTNAPGSRHAKRWQDVIEILDAGIDVYTTLNVQHIESRKENIETVTGITIRETVPDSILERASQIELVDITPADLLKRLHEGKVYLGEMAAQAIENFFKEDRLTALREIALRLTAEKVDNDLQTLLTLRGMASGWKSTERLMVAVSHSPYSEGLVRATRRLAFALEAPWIAVNVDTGLTLSQDDRETLARNLNLVRELGGELISTADTDIGSAINRIARERRITQLIVGRPLRRGLKGWFGRSILDRIIKPDDAFDILVLRPAEIKSNGVKPRKNIPSIDFRLSKYVTVFFVIIAVTLFNLWLARMIGYHAVALIFLLATLGISLFSTFGPILLSAALSALIWDFFFIPPHGTFSIASPDDIFMMLTFFVVAVITGTLTNRISKREHLLRVREHRMEFLYEIVQGIAAARTKEQCALQVVDRLSAALDGECTVLIKSLKGNLEKIGDPSSLIDLDEKELAVAKWAFDSGKPAGWSTDTLSSSQAIYLPLIGSNNTVGILVYKPKKMTKLMPEELEFLRTVTRQLSIGIEREILNEESRQTQQLRESERLHQTILDSISHEIRTPLTAIMGASSALQDSEIAGSVKARNELAGELIDASERLNLVVENLLDTSRLSSGMLKLNLEWCDPKDLISVTLETLTKVLEAYKVKVSAPEKLPLVFIDFHLMMQVLSNLIRNAAVATSPGKEIKIEIGVIGESFEIAVFDSGPGISEDAMKDIFRRFYRVAGTPAGGMGLGLWLAKNIVELHGGKISVHNRPDGGAAFSVSLPLKPQPEIPPEVEHGA